MHKDKTEREITEEHSRGSLRVHTQKAESDYTDRKQGVE